MSSLGDLYFALGLDDKKFNEAIEAAKKRISELSADISINLNVDAKKISEQVLKEIKSTTNTGIEVKTKVDTSVIENLKNLIKESREEVKKLEAEFSSASGSNQALIKSKLETARKRLSEQEHKLTTYSVKEDVKPKDKQIKLELDQESLTKVKEQLSLIEKPIVTKISVEYDTEKFQAVETAMKNFGQRISGAMNGGMNTGSSKQGGSSKQKKGVGGWLDRISDVLLEDEGGGSGNGAGNAASNIGATSEGLERLTGVLDGLNKQLESLSKKTESMSKKSGGKKRSVLSDDEEQAKRTLSQLQRLEEGIRRWQNVRARIEDSNVDKDSGNYKKAISLIEQYIAKLEEAKKMAGSFSRRDMAQMLGQTSTGEIAKAGRLIAKQKTDEQTVKSDLAREQAQIQRLEEGVRRLQNVIAKVNASGVDKSSENYRRAIAILEDYIDKLYNAKSLAGTFNNREMAGILGQTMSGEIAEAERLIAAQKKVEQSKKATSKTAIQQEKEELSLKKAKLQVEKEAHRVEKEKANAKKANLQKEKESLKVAKEQVSLQRKLGKAAGNFSNWASQFTQQVGNYISIYSIERFITNLYTIGGEFQKQHIALQNMIGDAMQGTAVFERMKNLAVKSPFTFADLASYTKQMSAYGIEYEKLYDTTKRLADISAGVGVDMGRLILAFGQVRSAAVLRGQELRQFTEAGIPLVAELAKKFSELEGRVVATGEVFEKISKREVSFEMVEDILSDMTDPGGRFFETQEKLAESLAGKWSNLKDAWDIMIADIANGNNGALKSLADTTSSLLRSWEKWAPAVMGAVLALGAYKTIVTALIPLQTIFNGLAAANPYIAVASILAGIGVAAAGYMSQTESAIELTKRLVNETEKMKYESLDKERTGYRYLDILSRQANTEEEKAKLLEKQEATYRELIKLYPSLQDSLNLEKLTVEDIEKARKRIAELTKDEVLKSYDNAISEALKAYNTRKQELLYENPEWLSMPGYAESVKTELDELYKVYTDALNRKEEYEQSLLDRKKTKPLADWQIKADEIIAKYPDVKALKREKGDDIWSYFDFLEETFKDAKEKYERATSAKLRNPYKKIMDAVNAVNMGIGGRSFYYKENNKAAKETAKRDADAYLNTLRERIREIGAKWDFFKELMDATGNKQLSFNLSGLGNLNYKSELDHLKFELTKELANIGVKIPAGKILAMEMDDIAKAIPDNEKIKRVKELYNAYHNASRDIRKSNIKDFVEILKASRDFEAQIVEIERKLQEDLKKLRDGAKEGGLDVNSEEYKRAEKKLQDDAESKKADVRFEEFKKSSDWVKVFDGLDRVSNDTLDNMIEKIAEFAKQANLSEEVTKQLVEAMAKLREESIERNPFKSFDEHLRNINNVKKVGNGMYIRGDGSKNNPFVVMNKKEKDEYLQEEYSGLNKSAQGIIKKFDAVAQAANMLGEVFSYLGSDVLTDFANILGGAMSGATQGAGIAKELFGAKAGVWGAVAGAALSMLSSVFAMHDNALQREIEASEAREKAISNIASNLERLLERTMGGINTIGIDGDTKAYFEETLSRYSKLQSAIDLYNKEGVSTREGYEAYLQIRKLANYSEDTINTIREAMSEDSYYDAQLAALKARRDEVNHQMDLEEGKKKKNDSKIEDYKQEIRELNDEIENFARDMAEKLYGIDFKDWANKLAESLVNAWATGEDAVLAYKNTVTDILRDLGVSIISQKIIEPMLNDTMEQFLAQFAKDNGVLTDSSMKILSGMYDQAEYAASATEAYLEGLKKMGIDISDTSKETSGGLSKGIESVTEDTANLLASYLNSIRQDVSIKRTLIEQLIVEDIPQMSIIAQAQLAQLNIIAANTLRNADAADRIYDLVNRVVDRSGNRLKV